MIWKTYKVNKLIHCKISASIASCGMHICNIGSQIEIVQSELHHPSLGIYPLPGHLILKPSRFYFEMKIEKNRSSESQGEFNKTSPSVVI
jgi:hypothetical protein